MRTIHSVWEAGIAGLLAGLLVAGSASDLKPSSSMARDILEQRTGPQEEPAPGPAFERRLRLAGGETLLLAADGTSLSLISASRAERLRIWPLAEVRRNASLTLLPSGNVLIWGGQGDRGNLQPGGYWFDSGLKVLEPATGLALSPRAGHTATVLTDGRVLFAGGHTEGARYELWLEDSDGGIIPAVDRLPLPLGHRAELQADGQVRLYGGTDIAGRRNAVRLWFDPQSRQLQSDNLSVARPETLPGLAASLPEQGAEEVAVTARLALRFSQRVRADDLNTNTVILLGPGGATPIRPVVVENGRLAFITPLQDLFPGAAYTLLVDGVKTVDDTPLSPIVLDFRTGALPTHSDGFLTEVATVADSAGAEQHSPPSIDRTWCDGKRTQALPCRDHATLEEGVWTPGLDSIGERWRMRGRQPNLMPTQLVARITEAVGFTTLTGQVLRVDGMPVPDVEVSIGTLTSRTDGQGRFWLYNAPAGRQEVYVDGTTANAPGVEYGQFVVGADIASGTLTQLPYTMYLPRISERDKIRISSPLALDTVLTHPDMPGLEIHVPAGTVIRDRKGKIVRELAIIPTPVDRAPYPTPENYPIYFMIDPGGAVIQGLDPGSARGIRIYYPNYEKAQVGTEKNFWIYDSREDWRIYGTGQVTPDGLHIAPQSGVALHETMGASYSHISLNDPPPEDGMPPDEQCCGEENAGTGRNATAGDPVDLRTGSYTYSEVDIAITDVRPISLGRAYRPNDRKQREFGIGTVANFNYYLNGADILNNVIHLVMPNGSSLAFNRESGTAGSSGTWRHRGATTGARMASTTEGMRITMNDGTVMMFVGASLYGQGIRARIRWVEDRYGNRTTYQYNSGQLNRIYSPSGRYIDIDYDIDNRISIAADTIGNEWHYTYNPDGYLSAVVYPDNSVRHYHYQEFSADDDVIHRLSEVHDRRGNRLLKNVWEADPQDPYLLRVTEQTLADGGIYNIDYFHQAGSDIGVLVTHPDGSKRRVVFDGDQSLYPASDTLAYGTSLESQYVFERDDAERVTAQVDPLGRRSEFGYNVEGRIRQVTHLANTPDAISIRLGYVSDGQVSSITDPLGRTTVFNYFNGCLSGIVDAFGRRTVLTCNGLGQPDSVTDALSNTTLLHYMGTDLAGITDPLGRSAYFYHDALGRLIAVMDAQGNVSHREYDAEGRVVKLLDPSGNETEIGYDANGNMTAVLMPNGSGITWEYDARDRVIERTDNLGQSEYWTWDTMNRVESHTDRKGQTTTFAYDALGRLATTTYHDGSTVTATYDAGDRLLSLVDSASGTLGWAYDGLDRVIEAISPQGSIAYEYDAVGRRTAMIPASQARIEYQYDAGDRLRRILQGSETYEFDYDVIDRLVTMTLPNGIEAGYAYNAASQLSGIAWHRPDSTLLHTLGYGYDSAGRRVTQTGSLAPQALPAASGGNSFDDNNRQTAYNGQALSYDANGNLTGDGTRTYVWNARDQLVEIRQGANTLASFGYDVLGRRYTKTEGGVTTEYLYDGLDAVQETQGSSVQPVLTGLNIDERYARGSGTGRHYFLTDALGSTRLLADGTGSIVQGYDYDPYGGTHPANTTVQNPYRYTGREQDGNGLYYYRARYYHPGMGRFVSEDPIGLAAGDLNVYAYVLGDPLSHTDPTGEFVPVVIGAGIGVLLEYITNPCATTGDLLLAGAIGALGGGLSKAAFLRHGARSRTRDTGVEWSHSIGRKYVDRYTSGSFNRALNQRGGLNGSWASPTRHYRHDATRFPPGWRDMGERLPSPIRALDRTPDWLKGSTASGAAGSAIAGSGSSCGCQ